jgi:dTDP-4-dehydrorhamnose 3,5-epimerase-like enzyme
MVVFLVPGLILRAGMSLLVQTLTLEINPGVAVFVPRGVANGYQTLEEDVTYTYLVNEHWSPDAEYTFVNLFDPELGIRWPIEQDRAIISEKDMGHPMLKNVKAMECIHG